jgi:hypothetical protein
MANLGSYPINVQTPSGSSGQGTNLIKLNFYYTVTYSGGDYYHYKTNIHLNSGFMGMIEFVGANYGGGMIPIRAAACFYAYPPYDAFINVGLSTCYTGSMTVHNVYKSSDNYAVIVVSTSNYYSGWVLNAYTANPTTPGFDIGILGLTQTSSNTAVY